MRVLKIFFPHVTGYRKSNQPNWPLLTFFIDSVINIRKEVAHLMSCFFNFGRKISDDRKSDLRFGHYSVKNLHVKWPFETHMEK